jgi:Xaa-Pro aminopeptidase
MDNLFAIDIEACRGRQRRLLNYVLPLEADDDFLVVVTRRESVQWLTGAFVRAPFEPIAALTRNGHLTLVLPDHQLSDSVAADEVLGYEGKRHSTVCDEQRSQSEALIKTRFSRKWKFVAVEFEAFPPELLNGWEPPWLMKIDSDLARLRRRKDADELRMLERANDANRAMYEHARRIVRPGLNELELHAEMYRVAVQSLGETPTYFGQDFRFCHPGGPARNREAQAGELLILDLGVGFRGYHSDNARTIAVDGNATADQSRAWKHVAEVFDIIQAEVRPVVVIIVNEINAAGNSPPCLRVQLNDMRKQRLTLNNGHANPSVLQFHQPFMIGIRHASGNLHTGWHALRLCEGRGHSLVPTLRVGMQCLAAPRPSGHKVRRKASRSCAPTQSVAARYCRVGTARLNCG